MRHHGAPRLFRASSDEATIAHMAKGSEKRDIRFSMRLPTSLHARLRKAADADRRTMADFVIIVVEKALDDFEVEMGRKRR